MKFHCPSCSQLLEADKEFYGQDINCPSCHREITIPHFDGRNRKEKKGKKKKMNYTHSFEIEFSFDSDNEEFTQNELFNAMAMRMDELAADPFKWCKVNVYTEEP